MKSTLTKIFTPKNRGGVAAFTLVELLVVISILAILAVIAFLSFNGFSSSARDSTRITDINSISKAFELFKVKGGSYPIPSAPTQDVVYSGGIVWTQGKLGDSVIQNLGNQVSKKPTDPSTGLEYDYSLTSLTQEYQIKANFEKTIAYNQKLPLPLGEGWGEGKAQAASTTVNIYLKGNYNEIFTKTQTGSTIYYIATPSLFINSGSLNLTSTGYYLLNKLSYDTSATSTGGIAFMPQLIYSSTGVPTTDSQFLTFATNLKSIYQTYSGTLINNNQGIKTLLNTPDTDTGALTNIGKAVIALKPISAPTDQNDTQTFTCSGTAPTPATGLTQSTTQPTDNITNWTYSSTTTTTGPACTWKCETGYIQNGNTCEPKLYVDDVFSTYLYTGNGGSQTITNGIDLAGQGGMVWIKERGTAEGHRLMDTTRGNTKYLATDQTIAQGTLDGDFDNFLSNGFSLKTPAGWAINTNAHTFSSWTFRKAPKFFDVVAYTSSYNTAPMTVSHSLGVAPGMIIFKRLDSGSQGLNWIVYHRSLSTGQYLRLNTTDSVQADSAYPITATATDFTIRYPMANAADRLIVGDMETSQWVAYVFAHDTSTDGIIQCGSTAGAKVTLGWEPQWIVHKSSNFVEDWNIIDTQRGMPTGLVAQKLSPNTSVAETTTSNSPKLYADGFELGAITGTHIYCAIRRPNKPVTDPTKVYNAIARPGTGAATTVTGVVFAPDLMFLRNKANLKHNYAFDRLRGNHARVYTALTNAENAVGQDIYPTMDGLYTNDDGSIDLNTSSENYINWFFRRAPGFFDMVAYTGFGVYPSIVAGNIPHNLGVTPELMIIKYRNASNPWAVYHKDLAIDKYLSLNTTSAESTYAPAWNNTRPIATQFSVGVFNAANAGVGENYIAYLFATLPNISKVGSYTGNGTSQPINAGFDSTARFILIKRTDVVGDWYVWDSARGIVDGNDPHLSLNTTAAEVTTDDSVDPNATGFAVNQNTATNINVDGGNYIYLAIH